MIKYIIKGRGTLFFTLTLLFFYIFLISLFNLNKLQAQNINKTNREINEMKAMCILGEKVNNFPFYIYKDAESGENNFFPTGYMGDFSSFKIDTYCKDFPYIGKRCIKITYNSDSSQVSGWAGLYWQYPPNNWGNVPKAYDLTGATKLTFWARGKHGGEVINKFQVGGITGKYRDSGVTSIGPVVLSKEWRKYTIDLRNMNNSIIIGNEDKQCWPFMMPLTRIIGGFCWATSLIANDNKSITFYLDEISFENV